MKKIWEIFASIKTAIFIFFTISITSIAGTLIKQQPTPEGYEQIYGKALATIIKALKLFDMYHSWWFQLLLVLFAINLIVCSIDRLPRTLKFFKKEERLKDISTPSSFQIRETISTTKPQEDVEKVVEGILNRFGLKIKEKGGGYIFAEKGVLNRIGAYIVHFSITIVLIGGLIGSIFGFTGNIVIVEGSSTRNVVLRDGNIKILPFEIKCNDFRVEYYKDKPGFPKEYISDVEIINDGKVVKKGLIRVNHPLEYQGINFYQSSYGIASIDRGTLTIRIKDKKSNETDDLMVPIGGEATSKKLNIKVKVLSFLPDLIITEQGPTTRSMELNNPAALIEVEGNNVKERAWIFAFFRSIHQDPNSPFEYEYLEVNPLYFTVLQANKDPGTPLIWIGCIGMMLAIFITFFTRHERVMVWIREEKDKKVVTIGLTTNRNRESFKHKAVEIINDLKESLGG
ncbi:MAG: cytochrome c biogenesis protein ResB [Thermosulfidibacteraceae bacterium]